MRCSYCYYTGHNRRSCPTMKERATLAAAKPEQERTWKEQRAIYEREQYASSAAASTRTCRYCGDTGHNIKKCNTREQDIEKATSKLVFWRGEVLEKFKANGIGVGAILKHRDWISGVGYPAVDSYHFSMVIGINKQMMTYWNSYAGRMPHILTCRPILNFAYQHDLYAPAQVTGMISSGGHIPLLETPSYDEFAADELLSVEECRKAVLDYFDFKRTKNSVVTRTKAYGDSVLV